MNHIFNLDFTSDHPMIKNHMILGQAILPGLAYIDMLYQFAKDGLNLDFRELSLKRLAIYNPLQVLEDHPTRVMISFKKKQGNWAVKVENAGVDQAKTQSRKKVYITAEFHTEKSTFTEQIDNEVIKRGALEVIDIKKIYAKAGKAGLVHKEVIKANGAVYITEPGCLIDVRVDEAFRDKDHDYLFHPALIDGAAMASIPLVNKIRTDTNKDTLFMPLSFESFYSADPLQDRCYVRINRASIKQKNDIFSYDMDFFNQDGIQVAKLNGITAKLLRHKGLLNNRHKDDQGISTTNAAGDAAGKPAETGLNTDTGTEEKEINTKNKGEISAEPVLVKMFSKYLNRSIGHGEINRGFYELGLESSQLLDLVKEIEDSFRISLSPSLLFEYSTISELVKYLDENVLNKGGEGIPVVPDEEEINVMPDEKHPVLNPGNYEFYEHEPYVQDYLLFGQPALLRTTYPSLVIESYVRNNPGEFPFELRNIQFTCDPAGLNKNEKVQIQVEFNQGMEKEGFQTLYRVNNPEWKNVCCKGEFIGPVKASPDRLDIDTMVKQSKPAGDETIKKGYYNNKNLKAGPMLQTIESAFEFDSTTFLGKVNLSGKLDKGNIPGYILDPLLLNSCYVLADSDAIPAGITGESNETVPVPFTIEKIIVHRPMTEQTWIVKSIHKKGMDIHSFDAMILSETGEMIAEVINASLKKVKLSELLHTDTSITLDRIERDHQPMDIAVVGIAGRYPGAKNLEEFWENLKNGRDCITEIPRDRWDWKEYFDEDKNKPGIIYSKWGGFLDSVDKFDPLFFNISPREAEYLDPQERLFLECAYAVLEDAGYTRHTLSKTNNGGHGGKVGIYVGVMYEEYQLYGVQEQAKGRMFAVGGNPSSVANRVSYTFNFHGPSMTVDTACSSSLTAIHLACRSLERGECDAALTGGVNVSIHPNKYLFLSQTKFTSSKGRCESFGIGGDGYVPGEGVGAVLLKPLARAIADGDHIYGVIKGSMINAGGKTSGYTVPNPAAQGEVIKEAIEKAGISARSISYIEAHGTGTSLGDPIEMTGLTKAFLHFTQDRQFCAIGSVKSNIGHCESAAGIAAVTKVILQMKYRKLVPSLHAEELNPNIDFSTTPFWVQRELMEWKSEYPRRAGISSFGAGGSNAHIVIEEYIDTEVQEQRRKANENPVIIVLSAKNDERLTQRVKDLHEALEKNDCKDEMLDNIAYTLQTGREELEERLGFTTGTIKELKEKLKFYLDGNKEDNGFSRGQAKGNKDISVFTLDEEMQEAVEKWIHRKKYTKLLDLWVKGLVFDWNRLYKGKKPRKISLPSYPFAGERYWIKVSGNGQKETGVSFKHLHPLLQENTSDFTEQRFSSVFTGNESFLSDYVNNGRKLLPGAVYLEMARAAIAFAAGFKTNGTEEIRLKQIEWREPVVVGNEPVKVNIGLVPEENGEIEYEVYSENPDGEFITHHRGLAEIIEPGDWTEVDIKELLGQNWERVLSSEECYRMFSSVGIEYGPGYRGIESVYIGKEEVLAKVSIPASVRETIQHFTLHPVLIDSAFQVLLHLPPVSGNRVVPVPLMIDEISINKDPGSSMWVIAQSGNPAESKRKFDIDLCDDQGMVCARFKGVLLESTDNDHEYKTVQEAVSGTLSAPIQGDVVLTPVWDKIEVDKPGLFPAPADRIVMFGGTENFRRTLLDFYPKAKIVKIKGKNNIEAIAADINECGKIDHVIWITPPADTAMKNDDALLESQEQGIIQLFRIIKALLGLGYGEKDLGFSVITIQTQGVRTGEKTNPAHAGVHGLIGTMAKEYPNWKVRLVDIEDDSDPDMNEIFRSPWNAQGSLFVHRSGTWYHQKLVPFRYSSVYKTIYREQGVYVVIGGAGGVGEVWSEYVIKTCRAKIIWIGRREMNNEIRNKIERLRIPGPPPVYISADASNYTDLVKAYKTIKKEFSRVNGLVQSAFSVMDNSLINMKENPFREGLASKIDVSVRMVQVFRNEPLDFILFFSSLSSLGKDIGKSSYVAGNVFEDAFTHALSREMTCAVKVVNWGYWGEVGSGRFVPQAGKNRLYQAGLGNIKPDAAMETLEKLLSGPVDQIAVLNTTKPLLMQGIAADEYMGMTQEGPVADVKKIQSYIPKQRSQLDLILKEGMPRIKKIEELLSRLLFCELQAMGAFAGKDTDLPELKEKTGLIPRYDKWIIESLRILDQNKYLKYDNAACRITDSVLLNREEVWTGWKKEKEVWMEEPGMKDQALLSETMLHSLPGILRGIVPATDIMFPNSSMKLVEGIYRDNAGVDYFNDITGDSVLGYINARVNDDPSVRIRIFEIGAGTGGTSAAIFRKLKDYREHVEEYCYTDLSRAFLLYGEKQYGAENPYLTYKIFNTEEPVAVQGISEGSYDVVIAAKVLHATKNIRITLRNAKALLKKNGILILNETAGKSVFSHLTFGLLEGWWRYEDSELRMPGSPGLDPQSWKKALEWEGFGSVIYPAESAHKIGQQVVIAVSDGVIRQKRTQMTVVKKTAVMKAPVLKEPVKKEQVRAVNKVQPSPQKSKLNRPERVSEEVLKVKSTEYIKKIVAETLKIPMDKLDSAESLETYGIDSILVVQLTNNLQQVFENVSSTLFFEYQTIDALAEYFLKNHRDSLMGLVGYPDESAPKNETTVIAEQEPPVMIKRKSRRFLRSDESSAGKSEQKSAGPEGSAAIPEGIAIVGMSGRFPGARNPGEYWENLKNGKDCIIEIPGDRWGLESFYEPDKQEAVKKGKSYCKWGGFIDGFSEFDPLFFNLSPRDTYNMDPQERLFLQCCWEVFEDAGYTRKMLKEMYGNQIGVFVGITRSGFVLYGPELWSKGRADFPRVSFSSTANRVSYLMDLQGPSMPIDTMCSSSLTAIHEACEHLYRGECKMAIAGGVNLYLHPANYIEMCFMQMLSEDGKCRTFGKDANGFVPGEGVGAVLLKRLSDAVKAEDHIYGVILGSSINHGGKTNGYTVPNPVAQGEVICNAIKRSGIDARSIGYIEAHGTGTSLGDPIEITGLTRAFQQFTGDTGFCAIGSVKSNIGHLESAAGIAAVIKVLLQIKHRKLVPSLHASEINPGIDFSRTPFVIQRELSEWNSGQRCIAGISSFGAGGANAHVLIAEYIAPKRPGSPKTASENPAIFVLSAMDGERLKARALDVLDIIEREGFGDDNLADIAYTLQTGREGMEERLGFTAMTINELKEKLKGFLSGNETMMGFYRGRVKQNKDTIKVLAFDEEMQETIEKWIQVKKYWKLLELWVNGFTFDWNRLYGEIKPRRIILPVYPFKREKYWIEGIGESRNNDISSIKQLHPLLHENTSDLKEEIW